MRRKQDPRPWQEREREWVEREWRRLRLPTERIRRAVRLFRFWHRDRSLWCVFDERGARYGRFGPTTQRAAHQKAHEFYEAERKRGRRVSMLLIEVFG
jgi:hypothetical protein